VVVAGSGVVVVVGAGPVVVVVGAAPVVVVVGLFVGALFVVDPLVVVGGLADFTVVVVVGAFGVYPKIGVVVVLVVVLVAVVLRLLSEGPEKGSTNFAFDFGLTDKSALSRNFGSLDPNMKDLVRVVCVR
jgi:hypothetical protein